MALKIYGVLIHALFMGRRSLAERIYEELEDVEEGGTWIVLYDFKEKRPGTKFWSYSNG